MIDDFTPGYYIAESKYYRPSIVEFCGGYWRNVHGDRMDRSPADDGYTLRPLNTAPSTTRNSDIIARRIADWIRDECKPSNNVFIWPQDDAGLKEPPRKAYWLDETLKQYTAAIHAEESSGAAPTTDARDDEIARLKAERTHHENQSAEIPIEFCLMQDHADKKRTIFLRISQTGEILQQVPDAATWPEGHRQLGLMIEHLQEQGERVAAAELARRIHHEGALQDAAEQIDALKAQRDHWKEESARDQRNASRSQQESVAFLDEIARLNVEVETLRQYGNRDCTAMADEELETLRQYGNRDCTAMADEELERLRGEVVNRNKRALEGDKASAAFNGLYDASEDVRIERDQLKAEVARLKGETPDWIPCSAKQPEFSQLVWFVRDGAVRLGSFKEWPAPHFEWQANKYWVNKELGQVTHWKPASVPLHPEPPKDPPRQHHSERPQP